MSIKMKEFVDENVLTYLIENPDLLKSYYNDAKDLDNLINQLKAYKSLPRYKDGSFKVSYFQKNKKGRFYVDKSLGLQSFKRIIRGTLAYKEYVDFDMVNAHPTLLLHLCKKNSIDCKYLEEYVKDRDTLIKELIDLNDGKDKSDIKTNIISIMYGSDYLLSFQSKWYKLFLIELKNINEAIINLYDIEYLLYSNLNKSKTNKKGSFISLKLQDLENEVLQETIKYFQQTLKIKNDIVMVFDGIMIRKKYLKKKNIDLGNISKHIFQQLNIEIQFSTKEFEFISLSNQDDLINLNISSDNLNMTADIVMTPEKTRLNELFVNSDFGESNIADFWIEENKSNCVYYDNHFYLFKDNKWHKSDNGYEIYKSVNDLHALFKNYYNSKFADLEDKNYTDLKKFLRLRISSLTKNSTIKNIKEIIQMKTSINYDMFDNNLDLLGFENGVYDLKNNKFRPMVNTDYVSMSTGWDFIEADKEDVEELELVFEKILPNKEERDVLLKSLSTCLDGRLQEAWYFLLGSGGNGKDLICTSFMKALLGDEYYIKSSPSLLISEKKVGACPELSNLKKKRMNVYSEPAVGSSLRCDILKDLTGCDTLNARDLYSSKTMIKLHTTNFIMQNKLLSIDMVDDAMLRRMNVIDFPAKFLSSDRYDDHDDKTNIYLANPKMKESKYIESIRPALFHILMKYYNIYKNDGYRIIGVPRSILDRSKEYIKNSNQLYNWFDEIYEISENKENFIKFSDIKFNFDRSNYFKSLTKKEQKYYNAKNLLIDLNAIDNIGKAYRNRKKINNKDHRNIFMGFQLRMDDEDEDNLDDI